MEGCLACDLAAGRRPLPGGIIHHEGGWDVTHCIGPLGVGTLIVVPRRHVLHVWELDAAESAALGPLLQRTTAIVRELTEPEQVYVTLWSHAGGVPGHVHFVVQPATRATMDEWGGAYGLRLQVAMFDRARVPPDDEAAAFADRARDLYARSETSTPAASGTSSEA
jgi:diadenosine tetraphosphate (Ap4A) HIT family hydrolase